MKLSSIYVLVTAMAAALAGPASVCPPNDNSHAHGEALQRIRNYKKRDHQLMAGYFRAWRDNASDPNSKVSMIDLPDCLDIVFVVTEGGEPDTFWDALNNTYVPALRSRGTKVVRTVNIAQLINSQEKYVDVGNSLLKVVYDYDLDGLDVTVDQHLSRVQLDRATHVWDVLANNLNSGFEDDKLLIYSTNMNGRHKLFRRVYRTASYVLVQFYGHNVTSLQRSWKTFSRFIKSKQYLIGFSFYEENRNWWGDTTLPIESSNAWKWATWHPSHARKGGIFSYAIDRDGVAAADDRIQPTNFTWTRKLISEMDRQRFFSFDPWH